MSEQSCPVCNNWTHSGWVKVEDRQPDVSKIGKRFVCVLKSVIIDTVVYYPDSEKWGEVVTHWLPHLDLPEEEE